jgi:hypothetical protein
LLGGTTAEHSTEGSGQPVSDNLLYAMLAACVTVIVVVALLRGFSWELEFEDDDQEVIARLERYEDALRTIRGPSDSGPFMLVYREAGGGYEGLQAVAEAALDE